jgi:hypothetical protein
MIFNVFLLKNNFLYRIISVDPIVDANYLLSASTEVDTNTEMSLLFLNPRKAKFPAKLLATKH